MKNKIKKDKSMLDRLVDLFIAPEEDFDSEVEETIHFEEVEENLDEVEIIERDFKEKEEPVVVKEEVKVEIKPKKSTLNIKADGPVENESRVPKKPRSLRREEYDLQPVISPYFGVKNEKKLVQIEKKPLIKNVRETKKSTFSEVISPIYGVQEKVEEIEETKKASVEQEFVSSLSFLKDTNEKKYDVVEEEENIALEDILANKEDNEDLIQFSLFGDDKKIHEEDRFTSYEDLFSNTDDESLPF